MVCSTCLSACSQPALSPAWSASRALAMASLIIFPFSGDISPRLRSAAAIEPGVGWWCARAPALSGAVGPLLAFAASPASRRACTLAISEEQGPAEQVSVEASAAELSQSTRRTGPATHLGFRILIGIDNRYHTPKANITLEKQWRQWLRSPLTISGMRPIQP